MTWRHSPDPRGRSPEGRAERMPGPIVNRLARSGRQLSAPSLADPRDAHLADVSPRRGAPALQPQRWCREVFDIIEWRRFEAVVETLFAQAGFETRAQPHGADGGVDVWLYSKHHADGRDPVSIVQCKHWLSAKVGVRPVRELRGVMAQHRIARGQFVTTSSFTEEARRFANDNGIGLHDTDGLLRLIGMRHPKEQEALLAVAFEGDYWQPTCASCGVKLVERTARESGRAFWGCENFPRCRKTMECR